MIEEIPMAGAKHYGRLKYQEIAGKRIVQIDEGEGDAIVFAHRTLETRRVRHGR